MESRRGRITPASRRRGRPARLARFRPGATYVTHDDDNLRAASTSTSAAFASSERSMRWTNSWRHASRDLYPEVGFATPIRHMSVKRPFVPFASSDWRGPAKGSVGDYATAWVAIDKHCGVRGRIGTEYTGSLNGRQPGATPVWASLVEREVFA